MPHFDSGEKKKKHKNPRYVNNLLPVVLKPGSSTVKSS